MNCMLFRNSKRMQFRMLQQQQSRGKGHVFCSSGCLQFRDAACSGTTTVPDAATTASRNSGMLFRNKQRKKEEKWTRADLNHRQRRYQQRALTNWATSPKKACSRRARMQQWRNACSFPGCCLHPCLQFSGMLHAACIHRNRLHPCCLDGCIQPTTACCLQAASTGMLLATTKQKIT